MNALSAKTLMERVFDEVERCTPETGYHLVGVDRFEPPGDCAYIVSHHATLGEAEAARQRRRDQDPDEDLHIYPHPDARVNPVAGPPRTSRQKGPRKRTALTP